MGTVCFKRQTIASALEQSEVKAYSRGSQRNLSISRCHTCNLLFECDRMYKRKTCALCIVEKSENFRKKIENHCKKRMITMEEWYGKSLKKHQDIEMHIENINKAKGVTVSNHPICKRIIGYP